MAQRCVHPFMIWPGGVPTAYPAGRLVEDSDPILKTHRHHFEGVEDIARRNTLSARAVEAATADPGELRALTPPAAPTPPEPFDPSEHTAPEVLAYLADADETEVERVLAAEAAGKNRKGILGDGPTPTE
ncbi:hypothetical protein [Streptomyces filamentosus]|uniref:hypothetical protein n=1 Tax=Streptomyces filamentosus TaxID=67294 RepID=UPI0037D4BDD0